MVLFNLFKPEGGKVRDNNWLVSVWWSPGEHYWRGRKSLEGSTKQGRSRGRSQTKCSHSKGMGPLQPWLASCLRDGVSELKIPTVAVATHCCNS